MSVKRLKQIEEDLLRLLNHAFLVLSFGTCSDILEVLANVFGKVKCAWILSLKNGNQLTKYPGVIICLRIAQSIASVTEPVVRKLTFVQWGVNTSEMKGSCAAITAHKVAVAST
jgi:hypothetical protein